MLHRGQVVSVKVTGTVMLLTGAQKTEGMATGFPGHKPLGADSANSGKGQRLGYCGLHCLKLKEER